MSVSRDVDGEGRRAVSGGRWRPSHAQRQRTPRGNARQRVTPTGTQPRREALQTSVGRITSGIKTKGGVVTYLIVGLDRRTHARWHSNVSANDVGTAKRVATARAEEQGIELVIAAVIGPNSAVVPDFAEELASEVKAA